MTHPPYTHSTDSHRAPAFPAALPAAVLAISVLLAGCGGDAGDMQGVAADQEGRVVRVETLVLSPSTFEDVVQITGTVEALDDATLSARTAGTVMSLAPLGASLSRGGEVARLDAALAQAAVEQAEAQVESAQAQFDLAEDNMRRNEPLYRDSVISAVEWENVRSQFNQAGAALSQSQAALSQAREQFRQTSVTTPFSGTVEEHFVEIGEQVALSTPVARVINTDRVKVVAGVPERYAADITVGTPVTVNFRAYAGEGVRSEVSFVGRAINPQNRTFPVEILIGNPTGTIKPEMVARVSVTRERIEGALVVPRAAIVRDEDGNSVFVVDRDGDRSVAMKAPAALGAGHGGNVVVTNLEEGDEVIVLGQSNLTEGDRVQVMNRYSSPDAAGIPTSDSLSAGG
ncbi:MAG: efflux RND transporter periplasmic adaptor subunit [Rhodothermales bacterium]